MTQFLIFLAVIGYGFYRWRKTKSETILYAVVLAALLETIRYPLYLPLEFALAMWAFFGFAVLFYKILKKRAEKTLYIFSIMFLGFGLIFLLQAIKSMGYQDELLAFLK